MTEEHRTMRITRRDGSEHVILYDAADAELSESPGQHPLIVDYLTARAAWKRLSKPARAAVEAAYRDGLVDAHVNTMAALERHGFMHSDCRLTDAGKAVAKWHVT